MTLDPTQAGGYIAFVIAACAAGFERWRGIKANKLTIEANARASDSEAQKNAHADLLAANQELIRLARETSEDWAKRFQREHEEYVDYRKEVHTKQSESQAAMLELSREVADLRGKTDVTKVIQLLEKQNDRFAEQEQVNKQITEALGKILDRLNA